VILVLPIHPAFGFELAEWPFAVGYGVILFEVDLFEFIEQVLLAELLLVEMGLPVSLAIALLDLLQKLYIILSKSF
jgi:hypothetical protein